MESIYRGETQHKKGRAYQYFWMFDRHMDRTMCCSMENATMKKEEHKHAYPDKFCRQNHQIMYKHRDACGSESVGTDTCRATSFLLRGHFFMWSEKFIRGGGSCITRRGKGRSSYLSRLRDASTGVA